MRTRQTSEDKLRAGVAVGTTDECWPWTRGRTRSGYGEFMIGGTMRYAHREAYILANGPIPQGMFVCHTCDNPPCCNPAHLFLGTHADNMADMGRKGRAMAQRNPHKIRGARNGSAKLTEDDVRVIRSACSGGESMSSVARRYSVSASTVEHIMSGRKWKHVLQEEPMSKHTELTFDEALTAWRTAEMKARISKQQHALAEARAMLAADAKNAEGRAAQVALATTAEREARDISEIEAQSALYVVRWLLAHAGEHATQAEAEAA